MVVGCWLLVVGCWLLSSSSLSLSWLSWLSSLSLLLLLLLLLLSFVVLFPRCDGFLREKPPTFHKMIAPEVSSDRGDGPMHKAIRPTAQ